MALWWYSSQLQTVLISNPKNFSRENFIRIETLTADTFSLQLQNISTFNTCARKFSVLFPLGSSNLLSALSNWIHGTEQSFLTSSFR